jgi:hypothetical protein
MGRMSFSSVNAWNSKNAGKECFTARDGKGYRHGSVLGKTMLYHKVAWAIYYGVFPSKVIDHINGDKYDNRIENLREVDQKQNTRNAKMSKRNKSGVTGVRRCNKSSKWVADIGVDMKCVVIGRYNTFEEAVAARKAAEKIHGYHNNHGRSLDVDDLIK